MSYSFNDNPFFKITNISDGLRTMLTGIPGGFYAANEVLKVSGVHSNRTSEQLFNDFSEETSRSEEIVNMILFRLSAELNIITNRNELISGFILLMTTGILIGHWKKFKLDTNFTPKKYALIHKKQLEFEKSKNSIYVDEDGVRDDTINFNKLHSDINNIIENYYTELSGKVDKEFNELFTLLSVHCNISADEYVELATNRHLLLERVKNENYPLRLLKSITSRCKDIDLWAEYLKIKDAIVFNTIPQKMQLCELFGITKDQQYTGQKKFVAHFKYGFRDDLNSIFDKLNLEIK